MENSDKESVFAAIYYDLDKHYLKKDDEEEKKMSSHSSSHGFHCNCVAQQSQLIKEVWLSPEFGNGLLHIMYACNSMISSLTLH
ncbi:unnamed protein product [Sphagnum troendelagicum]|uniref:Uncharacterized protein n=1 Tax=Sphagnum troendelagicum TaxID=128251 RepID=A0ABP0UA50_9BRYO